MLNIIRPAFTFQGFSSFVHHSHCCVQHQEEAAPPVYAHEDLLAARFRVSKVIPYQSASPPFISNLLLAIFSGLLLVFAFPEWNWWSLGWVCTAPLIMAVVREQRFWRSLLLGYVAGTIFYVGSSYWVTHSMHNYGEIPLWLSYVITTVFASALSIFTGLFAGALALAIKRFRGWAILSAPVLWAASEWARLEITGVGWNALGYSQAFQPAVIQVARLGGVYLVSAIMVAASTALVFALIYLERRRGIIVLTAAGVIAILTVIYGESLRPEKEEAGSVTVAIIQPDVPIEVGPVTVEDFIALSNRAIQDKAKQAASGEAGARSISDSNATGGQLRRAGVDVVIWPESPMNFEYDRDFELQRTISEFTSSNNVFLLMNSWGFPKDDTIDARYNSALAIAPDGRKIFEYDKIALVPFGEYVPARSWLPFMDKIPALVADITPGASFTLGDVAGARLGTAICFEATRPDIVRRLRLEGATALVQISNELWFGPGAAPRQMLACAVFRAVENNVELIRSTNSGLSARIDRYGIVRDETPMFEQTTRLWNIKTVDEARGDSLTFYTRYGDVFAVACAVLSITLVIVSILPKREHER
ncbi:MAG TPA: apolipoprotein N-acyltransferase [Blastocatellia bacterium]|nr:apolipoprotein N-acyltransferase [Blastocatellia bacterium]